MNEDVDFVNSGPRSVKELKEFIKIGPIFLTRYERARILGARALQISMGAPVIIEFSEEMNLNDPLLIAEEEMKENILPISIRRSLPDGRYQDIPFTWLIKEKGKRTIVNN